MTHVESRDLVYVDLLKCGAGNGTGTCVNLTAVLLGVSLSLVTCVVVKTTQLVDHVTCGCVT